MVANLPNATALPVTVEMAIGDNFNDVEMLEFAGTAVVMGNADPSLLERDDLLATLSNDENGVAAAIDHLYSESRRPKSRINLSVPIVLTFLFCNKPILGASNEQSNCSN
ncbi:MAG: HAD hydrolase family protein [Acidobacteria bacterium]|nr:HAD hydrolase family protein [Acidobacteriota bacterium]